MGFSHLNQGVRLHPGENQDCLTFSESEGEKPKTKKVGEWSSREKERINI